MAAFAESADTHAVHGEDRARIEAALLLPAPVPVDAGRLRTRLSRDLANAGLDFTAEETGEGWLFAADRLHVSVAVQARPLPPDRLSPALESALPLLVGEDWGALARSHAAAITIVAAPGPSPGQAADSETPLGSEALDTLRTAAHVAATELLRQTDALAVLWDGSAQVFGPERFAAMADLAVPLPLILHPKPIFGRERSGGPTPIGFDLVGAKALIGHSVTMKPAHAPFGWLVSRALAYVADARAMGRPIPPGDSFEVQPGERIAVARSADGGVQLRLAQRDGVTLLDLGTD